MKLKLVTSFTIIFVLGASLLASAALHKKGYCISQWRILSDSEKITIAVGRLIKKFPKELHIEPAYKESMLKYSSKRGFNINEDFHDLFKESKTYPVTIPYKSLEEFLIANPKCCKFIARDFVDYTVNPAIIPSPPTFFEWVKGENLDKLVIEYTLSLKGENEKLYSVPAREMAYFNNCGYVYID